MRGRTRALTERLPGRQATPDRADRWSAVSADTTELALRRCEDPAALAQQHEGDHQGGDRVRPPETECRIEHEAGKRHRRKRSAGLDLPRFA